ncbi:unnamed protein product [Rotaria sordida]|uniref:F-box domain-containing protein n=1 Tax=Rotaria sordida TaxID=392033 RepID=A0A815QLR2_9BILA|nr:unnamed protein product [Rotaria sordida]CAF1642991.1 unnamed protein product [Rotaria sordida]
MKTSIEQLPVELWISIFSYFEAHDLFQAFTNLNNYFDQLIASDYLLFNVRLGKSDHNPLEYSIQPYWSNSILNRIISLHPIIQHKTSHIPEFLRWHCTKLIQLKSLKVKLRRREIPTICIALQQLKSLSHLFIECIPNQMLLETILSLPVLRVCQLVFLRAITSINCYSNQMSKIEKFYIKLQDDSHNSIINLLLSRMPKLKKLEINNSESYFNEHDSLFIKPLFILSELQTIKISWSSRNSDRQFFENFHQILPNLKCLYFNFIYDYFTEDFFNILIHHWWPTIENLERINIFIKFQRPQMTIDNDMQINLDKFQSILLAMNDKYNGFVNFKWTEKFFIAYKMIEISICKYC